MQDELDVIVVKATLSKTVEYARGWAQAGVEIQVDVETHIALIGKHHVQLDASDYKLVAQN